MKLRLVFFLLFFSLLENPISLFAQTKLIDSLTLVTKSAREDTNMVMALNKLAREQAKSGNINKAISYAQRAINLAEKIKYPKGQAAAINNLGNIYLFQGKFSDALNYFFKSLHICEKYKIKSGTSSALGNIGVVYENLSDYDKALEFHNKSLAVEIEIGNKKGIATSYNSIGNLYFYKSDYKKVFEYYTKSLEIKKEIGDISGTASTLANIGNLYFYQHDNIRTLEYYMQALPILEELDDQQAVGMLLNNIAEVCKNLKQYKKAIDYSSRSLKIAKSINSLDDVKSAYKTLSEVYDEIGNKELAYENFKNFVIIRDSIFNEENTKKAVQAEMNYKFEKKENATRLLQDKKDAISREEAKKHKLIIWFVSGILILVFLFTLFIYRGTLQIRKANKLLSLQKIEIESKNKDVTDSIKYARRIQEAIFPRDEMVAQLLPDSFILFKPKDIVSGDFYWVEEVDENVFFAAVDCTGHGVPGAFMSIVGFNLLKHAINEHLKIKPSEILDQVNKDLSDTLQQKLEESTVKDGMDMVLCKINKKTKTFEFSGANNPLYLIRDNKLQIFKGDKQPIGAYVGEKLKQFTNQSIDIKAGDVIYIFTDGFADQFGGKRGKKYKYKQFGEMLLSHSHLPMPEQKEAINNIFNSWREGYEQLDDVLVMGIRIT